MGLMKQIQIEIDNSEALKYLFNELKANKARILLLEAQLSEVLNY